MSPASTCGVVGLRPTYGRVSRYGCMTLRWTLDKVGAMARSVADTALVLEALHGPDGRDETVPDLPFAWDGRRDLKGLRIGYVEREFSGHGSDRRRGADRRARRLSPAPARRSCRSPLPGSAGGAIYALLNAEAGAMFDELVRSGRHQ